MTESLQAETPLQDSETLANPPLGLVLVKGSLEALLGHFCAHSDLEEAAINCDSLYSSKQVAQGQSLKASDIGQHQSPF